jgi:hypothetical protein
MTQDEDYFDLINRLNRYGMYDLIDRLDESCLRVPTVTEDKEPYAQP